ncbi:TetR family transcriptional regulator [Fusibacter bizertensis]
MKRTKQINESKELIFEAFMQLLNEKSEEDITLTEIAEVAGVGRMTIYRHFREKEDILLYKVQQYYEVGKRQLHDKSLTLLDLLAFKYELIKESPNIEYFYKNNKLQSLFDTFRAIYSADIKKIFPSSIDAYTVAFIISGMDAITNLWLQNGKNEDPKQMAQLTAQIIKRQLA